MMTPPSNLIVTMVVPWGTSIGTAPGPPGGRLRPGSASGAVRRSSSKKEGPGSVPGANCGSGWSITGREPTTPRASAAGGHPDDGDDPEQDDGHEEDPERPVAPGGAGPVALGRQIEGRIDLADQHDQLGVLEIAFSDVDVDPA